METNCNSAGLTQRVMVLGIASEAAYDEAKVQASSSAQVRDCVRVHHELAETSRLEARVWIAVAISAVASLLLSFWLA